MEFLKKILNNISKAFSTASKLLIATCLILNSFNINLIGIGGPNMGAGFGGGSMGSGLGGSMPDLGFDEAGLQEFMDAIQNLSPDELKILEELGQQIENEMRTQGLNPDNPEDFSKWAEKQMAPEAPSKPSENNLKEAGAGSPVNLKEKKEIIKKPEITQVIPPKDAQFLLYDTTRILSNIRQKINNSSKLSKKIAPLNKQLNDLQYYLNILAQPLLLKHLTSKDFEPLYKKLQNFYKMVGHYDQLILVKEPCQNNESNPYLILGISPKATQKEIQETYDKLYAEYNVENLKKILKEKNITGKEYKNKIKEASVLFTFIQDAYDSLKDPKLRAIIDKSTREECKLDLILEESSITAFNSFLSNLKAGISELFPEIEKLMSKIKPEELELAKLQEEAEKIVAQRFKQRLKPFSSSNSKLSGSRQAGDFDAFYRDLERTLRMRKFSQRANRFNPSRANNNNNPFGGPKGGPNNPSKSGSGGQKPGAKPEDKKKEGEKKSDEKKSENNPIKASVKRNKPQSTKKEASTSESAKVMVLIEQISEKLKAASKEIVIEVKEPVNNPITRKAGTKAKNSSGPKQQPEVETVEEVQTLEEFMQHLNRAVTNGPIRSPNANNYIKEFSKLVKRNKFYDIANAMFKLNKLITSKEFTEKDIAKEWKSKVAKPYAKMIKEWAEFSMPILDIRTRVMTPQLGQISQSVLDENYRPWQDTSLLQEPAHTAYREGNIKVRLKPNNTGESVTPDSEPLAWDALDIFDISKYFNLINTNIEKLVKEQESKPKQENNKDKETNKDKSDKAPAESK